MATYVKDTRTGYQVKLDDTAGLIDAAITAHEAAVNPHPTYLTQAEGDAAYSALGHNHDADYADIAHNHDADYADIAHTHSLNDLTDVTVSTPSTGQVLKYNGSAWINDTDATGGGGGAREIKVTIDGGGAAIATGVVASYMPVSAAGTVSEWYIAGTPSGSIVVDIIKAASAIPTSGDSMTGGVDRPTLSAATVASDTTLSGWSTTSLAAGDVLGVNVISASTIENCVITLKVT